MQAKGCVTACDAGSELGNLFGRLYGSFRSQQILVGELRDKPDILWLFVVSLEILLGGSGYGVLGSGYHPCSWDRESGFLSGRGNF